MTATTGKPSAGTARALDRQGRIGLALAGAILVGWGIVHVYATFFYAWGAHSAVTAPLLIALVSWLYAGLFIVAHDCMHGSLVPTRPDWNRSVGRLCLMIYAGFDFDRLRESHRRHHRHSGTEYDPDFDPEPPHRFLAWYRQFLAEYFTWRQMAFMAGLSTVYLAAFGAPLPNLLALWALPAILSSVQLFYFGTYLPHRPGMERFSDHHRARSSAFGWWASLLSCYHFGYHHEHHVSPGVPWWRLPAAREEALSAPPET